MAGRTERLSRQIQKDMGSILDRFTTQHLSGTLLTITEASVTPDLGLAKIYLSVFSNESTDKILELLAFHNKELRMKLAAELKNQIRRVPEIKFYIDDTLEKALKMDALIDSLSKTNKDSE